MQFPPFIWSAADLQHPAHGPADESHAAPEVRAGEVVLRIGFAEVFGISQLTGGRPERGGEGVLKPGESLLGKGGLKADGWSLASAAASLNVCPSLVTTHGPLKEIGGREHENTGSLKKCSGIRAKSSSFPVWKITK